RIFQQKSNIAYVRRLSAGVAHASAQANGRKPARHGEAHSSIGERDRGRASVGRGRQGTEQDKGTAEERRRGDGQKWARELSSGSANRLSACGRALRPWLWRTPLPAAVLDPSGQASPAEGQPCRTGAASFMVGKALGRARRRA